MTKIAIIGTAGRDKTKPMTRHLWDWMLQDAQQRIPLNSHLVSGGAAWADHVAVALFLMGHASELTLHLPAPFQDGQFYGPRSSSASAANWYHEKFWQATSIDSLYEIAQCEHKANVDSTFEPAAAGYAGMFARNKKVARDATGGVLAYTFGEGDVPADGGTRNTWDLISGPNKVHVTLPILT